MPDNDPESSRDVDDPSPAAEQLRRSPSRDFAGIPERLQSIRNSLRQERAAANAARSAAELSRRLRAATPPTSSSRLRMRAVLRQLRDSETDETASADVPDNAQRLARLHARADERPDRLGPSAARRQPPSHLGRPPSDRSSLTSSFQDLEIRLAQANTELRSLLDSPLLSDLDGTTSRQRTRARSRDDEYGGRRKRRRLNSTGADDQREIPQIEYGWHGQAIPGKLKMQLISSDGGICERHRDWMQSRRLHRGASMTSYAPENVLKDDKSVYSSRGSTCNMVLAHQDESIFTIDRLVVKAPKHGFTDPVQEGLVFATMNQDETFDRTCRFRMDNLSASWLMTDSEYNAPYEPGNLSNLVSRNRSNTALDLSWPPLVPMRRHDCDSSSSSDTDSEDGDLAPTHLFDPDGEETSTRLARTQATWARDLSDQDIEQFTRSMANIPTERFDRTESLARFDFDEVLRRGDMTAADRRRRRTTTGHRSGRDTPIPEREDLSDYEEIIDTVRDSMQRHDERMRLAFEAENKGLLVPLARFSMHRGPVGSSASSFARRRREQHSEQMQELRERANALDFELRQSVLPPMRPPLHRDATSVLPPIDYLRRRDTDIEAGYPASQTHEAVNHVFQWQQYASAQRRRDNDYGRVKTTTSEYKTVIKFDPPVDSRYLLLKLWNPKNTTDGTIDVRTIKVYGWAGARWYPALEMR